MGGIYYWKIIIAIVVLAATDIDSQTIILDAHNQEDVIRHLTAFADINNETEVETVTNKPFPEVPKSTMDIITVIWYLSTFLALAAFFFLMVCSDRRCGRSRGQSQQPPLAAPPTPAPSYSEFAPPSYESVVKSNNHKIFVVPIDDKSRTDLTPTDIRFHTVNELQKIS